MIDYLQIFECLIVIFYIVDVHMIYILRNYYFQLQPKKLILHIYIFIIYFILFQYLYIKIKDFYTYIKLLTFIKIIKKKMVTLN